MRGTRHSLTLNRLHAIAEALAHRIAGGIDQDHLNVKDYELARGWAEEQIAKKERKSHGRT